MSQKCFSSEQRELHKSNLIGKCSPVMMFKRTLVDVSTIIWKLISISIFAHAQKAVEKFAKR
jgi:hypothetical protein